jgi:Putative Flp pilus-assembly TadE/G-like
MMFEWEQKGELCCHTPLWIIFTMQRKSAKGSHIIYLVGLMLISLMTSSLAIDMGYYFAFQNRLQTAADSAALAATDQMYRSMEVDPATRLGEATAAAQAMVTTNESDMALAANDVVFGFVDPVSKVYQPTSFAQRSTDPSYAPTSGYNAVRVRVMRSAGESNSPLETIMAKLLGIQHMDTGADAVAFMDQSIIAINNGGLRPIYACQAQFNKAMSDGVAENNVVRIYGDHVEVDGVQNQVGCPPMGSGNWGFADLRNCSPDAVGSSTIGDWFATGFPGIVNIGQCYSTDPGNFIQSIETQLNNLITGKSIFPIPMYDSWQGSGSNSQVNVNGFVGFQISGYKATGSQETRYIEGRFHRMACTQGCIAGANTSDPNGGSLAKIRLASRE